MPTRSKDTKMGRGPALPLAINGEALTSRQFNERVIDTLRVYGERGGSAKEIAEDWGDATWQDEYNRRRLSNRLNGLAEQGTLIKAKHGRYVVNMTRIDEIGVSLSTQTEHQVIKAIRDRGGFAVMSEIAADFGIEQSYFEEDGSDGRARTRNSQYASLRSTLDRSTVIRKAFGLSKVVGGAKRAVYFLSGEMMRSIPLTGANALMMLVNQLGAGVETVDVEMAFDRHCSSVAAAVLSLMEVAGVAYSDLADQLIPSMEGWYARYPSHRRVRDYERFVRDRSVDEDEFLVDQAFEETTEERLFGKFVDGDADAHKTAPLAFYYALAAALMVDAPALSRGSIEIAY